RAVPLQRYGRACCCPWAFPARISKSSQSESPSRQRRARDDPGRTWSLGGAGFILWVTLATMEKMMIRCLPATCLVFAFSAMACAQAAERPRVTFINSESAKAANYPFSQAVQVGHTLYLSGQIGTDPANGKLVTGGIVAEARQAMQNIEDLLAGQGHSMRDVVKCTVM